MLHRGIVIKLVGDGKLDDLGHKEPLPERHAGGGWSVETKLTHCRECKGPITAKYRRTFCSQPCVDRWLCRASSAGARRVLFKRDKGVCAICGLDCEALRQLRWYVPLGLLIIKLSEYGIVSGRKHYWDADHTIPVVKGNARTTQSFG